MGSVQTLTENGVELTVTYILEYFIEPDNYI